MSVKSIKVGFMIGLLMMSSNLFCNFDESMNQATTDLYYTTIAAVRSAIIIGASSYVVDAILSNFASTKNMENRGAIASGTCASLYVLFLLSAEYKKNDTSVAAGKKSFFNFTEDAQEKTFDEKLLDAANSWVETVSRVVCRMAGIKEDSTSSAKK